MIQIILVIFVVTVLVFIWLKNKQYNRSVDKHSRMADKQEELLEMLRRQSEVENKKENNTDKNDN
jgi:nitrogen fixation-related uncharacterized protein